MIIMVNIIACVGMHTIAMATTESHEMAAML